MSQLFKDNQKLIRNCFYGLSIRNHSKWFTSSFYRHDVVLLRNITIVLLDEFLSTSTSHSFLQREDHKCFEHYVSYPSASSMMGSIPVDLIQQSLANFKLTIKTRRLVKWFPHLWRHYNVSSSFFSIVVYLFVQVFFMSNDTCCRLSLSLTVFRLGLCRLSLAVVRCSVRPVSTNSDQACVHHLDTLSKNLKLHFHRLLLLDTLWM